MSKVAVNLNVKRHIAHVQLCRPEKMNALNQAMISDLIQVAEQIKQDESIRVVLIAGDGGNFCSGLDKSNFSNLLKGEGLQLSEDSIATSLSQRTHDIYNLVQAIVWQWREMSVPVLAAIEGVALGGGLQIALGADIRYASPHSKFSILEIKWGLVPDMGSTQLMRHLASDDIIRELTYTGRKFSAKEAKEFGLITGVTKDPIAHCMELAEQICLKNPEAIRACKSIYNAAPYLTVADGMLMESQLQDRIIGSDNQIEAVMAAMEKRLPNFKD